MFSNWRDLLAFPAFPAFPTLRRPNSEPELNSPNFEAFSDDEWIMVNEKNNVVLSDGLDNLKLKERGHAYMDQGIKDDTCVKASKTIRNNNRNPLKTEGSAYKAEGDFDERCGKRDASSNNNRNRAASTTNKTRDRQLVDARIQQRRQLEELLFENNNNLNNYSNNNYSSCSNYNNYYKATAKATRSQLRRRQRQTDPRSQAKFCNDTRRRRRRDMSC